MVGEDIFRFGGGEAARPEAGDRAYQRGLAWAALVVWAALAVAPANRGAWLAENVLVAGMVVALYLWRDTVRLSNASSTALFAFLCAHEVGAHHTYPGVPYDAWVEALAGGTLRDLLGVERNHFDRLAHLLFGLLLTQPLREALMQTSAVRGRWGYVLPVAISMAASAGYEVAEWCVAVLVGGDLGPAFLGAQGDVWDAQKDLALASGGAMLAMTVVSHRERARAAAAAAAAGPARTPAAEAPAPADVSAVALQRSRAWR